jgi:hypothetical protein
MSLLVNDPVGAWYVVAYGRAEIVSTGHDALARVLVRMRPDRLLTGR